MRMGSFMTLVVLTATLIAGCSKKAPVAEGEADKPQVAVPGNGQPTDVRQKKTTKNADFDLARLKFPASFDFTQGPNGEEIKSEEVNHGAGYPDREKWYYYIDNNNQKTKHGLYLGYVKSARIIEMVYVHGKLRLHNAWNSKGHQHLRQEYFDSEWNEESQLGENMPQDISRFLVRFIEVKMTKYENGGHSAEEIWERIPHGETTKFYTNGNPKEVTTYNRGKVVSQTIFDSRGKVIGQK